MTRGYDIPRYTYLSPSNLPELRRFVGGVLTDFRSLKVHHSSDFFLPLGAQGLAFRVVLTILSITTVVLIEIKIIMVIIAIK